MLCLVLCLFCVLFCDALKIEVKVKQGKLIGTKQITIFNGNSYFAFYGVPYAEPPIGRLRFQDPKSQKSWEKPYDATTEFRGACAQLHIVHKNGLFGYEDCLRLNIYTPSLGRDKRRAVIVWIHGYAFTSSFSHIYGPDFLIDRDVILITVTHRIGVFGFLKVNSTDSHANMGLKDIVTALKWIRKNVKAFDGDINNITVMGSGSGATFLALLLNTKHNKLFSKMILHSGTMISPALFQGDHSLERDRLEAKLLKQGYKTIYNAPTKAIVEAANQIYRNKELINKQKPLIPFLPIIESKSNKSLITKNPIEYFRNKDLRDKPILIGFTSQESISEVLPFLHNPLYLKAFEAPFKFMVPFSTNCEYNYTTKMYADIGNHIKGMYFKNGISESSTSNFLSYVSDLIKFPIYHFIQTYLQNLSNKMHVYKFNYVGSLNVVKATSINGVNFKVKGAASGDEICYIMKCEPIWETYVKMRDDQNNRDRSLIKQLTALWTNFAKSGDPTPNTYMGNVTWPPATLQNDNVLLIGNMIQLVDAKQENRMYKFWNEIYRRYYEHCNGHDEL